MKFSFENKRAIVCGGTDGIGKETAHILANLGCEITLAARDVKKLNNTISNLADNHGQYHNVICADFNNAEQLEEKVHSHLESIGKTVDILINNSGGPHGGPIIQANENEFRVAFERLLIANQIMAKAVFPGMKKKGSGRIINIISTSVRQVIPGLGVSNTIRGSVAQWGKTLALELGEYGICVNNVLPGYTETSRLKELAKNKSKLLGISIDEVYAQWENNTSLRRLGTPQEIANIIVFLASDASSYVTGHNFSVDGGRFGA